MPCYTSNSKNTDNQIKNSVSYPESISYFHPQYSEVPLIRPPMEFVESGLNSEMVSLMRPIYIGNRWF